MDLIVFLWIFVKVVEVGFFVVVVEVLDLLLQLVGKYIQVLEYYLGVCLFNCIMCKQSLIDFGQVYLVWVWVILEEVEGVE